MTSLGPFFGFTSRSLGVLGCAYCPGGWVVVVVAICCNEGGGEVVVDKGCNVEFLMNLDKQSHMISDFE